MGREEEGGGTLGRTDLAPEGRTFLGKKRRRSEQLAELGQAAPHRREMEFQGKFPEPTQPSHRQGQQRQHWVLCPSPRVPS